MKKAITLIVCWLTCSIFAAETTSTDQTLSWSGTVTNADGKVLATISVDTSETPELADWGRQAGMLCAEWYPKVITALPSEGFTPANKITLHLRKDMKGVAATSGNTINVAANYVKGHPNDLGMVAHELTHVVQAYPRSPEKDQDGWLVEGIADYIRLYKYEPNARRPRIDPKKASYRDAYKTTAIFLDWAQSKHDADLVKKLNAALRTAKYHRSLFKDYTGKTVDELWEEFIATLENPPSK